MGVGMVMEYWFNIYSEGFLGGYVIIIFVL